MNPILVIKKNKKIKRLYIAAWDMYYSALTIISPTLNTKARYKQATGKKLNLSNPKAFNEKLLWLKLNDYIKNPLVIQCADKYRVRSYIKKCGYSDLLTKTYGVYKNADEIPWEDLPDKFVLKWNFGAGMNVLCSDKNKFDIESAVQKLDKWGRTKYWLPYSEMQYKYAPKKIICEEFLENEDEPGVIPDYKVYCFHGKPLAIFVMHDRGKKIKTEFFDTNWNLLDNSNKYETVQVTTKRPECLEQMLEAAKVFSAPFPFVRCDFYIVSGKLYFGELTFTPAGGLAPSQTKIDGKSMAEYLKIPKKGGK